MSVTPVVIVAVYVVALANDAVGLKVAVVPESVTDPATLAVPALSVNVVPLTSLTASLKVAVTLAPTCTAVAPLTGLVELTAGGVVSVGGGGGGGVVAGMLAASPGKVLAVISAMLEYPSPSESRDSTLVILVIIATVEPNDRMA
jgi:hypothetical protein